MRRTEIRFAISASSIACGAEGPGTTSACNAEATEGKGLWNP